MPGNTAGTAVIVLAAGAGTRMCSDIPKVLHTLGGPLHAGTRRIRGSQRESRASGDRARARTRADRHRRRHPRRVLGRRIEIAVQEQQLGTGHAVACGLQALPAGFAGTVVVTSGDIPLLDRAPWPV